MDNTFQCSQQVQSAEEQNVNLLESEEFLSAKGKVPVPIGISDSGKQYIRDLSTIPHILICGMTGVGKTAFAQTLLSVMVFRQSLDDVKIVLYDAKRVEYAPFYYVPHLWMPVINDRNRLVSALFKIAQESRTRLHTIANAGCKDYDSYNALKKDIAGILPEIFVVLDDIFSQVLTENETKHLLEILKNGRIAGIHIIAVSSVNYKTIPSELLMSIPCRICFRLSSGAESKVYLEQAGAEKLFVPGELVYKYQNEIFRCQSAYAPYENIEVVMENICQKAVNVSAIGREAKRLFEDTNSANYHFPAQKNDYDELIAEAAEAIIDSQKGLISILQRTLKIGYKRASAIMEQLYSLGVVGQENGIQPRTVLMTVDEWNDKCTSIGLHRINKKTKAVHSASVKEPVRNEKQNTEDEPAVKLRDFAEFSIDGIQLSIHDNEIHFTKPIMTRLGMGTITPSFSAKNVTGLIYKKPSLFRPGYMTFEFAPGTNIDNKNPYLLLANMNNISELLKIEFRSGSDRIIRLFLQQLSEDIGIPITRL